MSLRAEVAAEPPFPPLYWFARYVDARHAGDSLMVGAAREQLLSLGFDVQAREARRTRRRGEAAAIPSDGVR